METQRIFKHFISRLKVVFVGFWNLHTIPVTSTLLRNKRKSVTLSNTTTLERGEMTWINHLLGYMKKALIILRFNIHPPCT